ncbi:uncharacterized protein LOC131333421 [Rhododendron vialii]|uniref:uncharacterized protein LOC131333421 n=1 Tax=Rhododendron vialii TaxID=182163 RepID=UPI00265F4042|nr:uncharacterized protein LOC131333421 [Rhododendron vialii]
MLSKPIREISLKIPTESVEFSTEAAKMALRAHHILVIKLVRLCKSSCGCRDAMYYIYLSGQEGWEGLFSLFFQALVHNSGRMHIEFCREEKKPKLTEVGKGNVCKAITVC